MRILLVTSQYPPTPGGGGVYTRYLVDALCSVRKPNGDPKCEIRVLTASEERPTRTRPVPNVEIHKGTFSRDGRVAYERTVGYGLKLCKEFRPQVIHGQHFDGAYVAAQLRAAFPGARLYVTFHKSPTGTSLVGWEQRDPRVTAMLSFVRHVDKFVVPCQIYRDELLSAGIKPRFLELIWPGIDVTSVKDIAVGRKMIAISSLEKMGLQFRSFERIVLCPARLDPTKDIETLIRAAGVLKRHLGNSSRVAFLIAGRSNPQPDQERRYEEDLLAIARREGVLEDVFIGSFDIHDMYAVYKLCDACVLPSVREALGLVLIEAMALSVPVIVANVDGVTDVAVPEVNSLAFSSRNHEELANCLERILFDRNETKRLVKAASRTIRERFSYERMGREHYDLYRGY